MRNRISSYLPAVLRYLILRGMKRLRSGWGIAHAWTRFLILYLRHKLSRPENIRSILVIRLSGLGDVVRTTPVLRKLREAYPNAVIHYFTKRAALSILQHNPNLDAIYTEESVEEVTKRRYDWVINLMIWDTEPLVRDLLGRVSYQRVSGPYVTRWGHYKAINQNPFFRSSVERLCRTAFVPYKYGDEEHVKIFLSDEQLERACTFYQRLGIINGQPYIGLHLGSNETGTSSYWKRNISVSYLRQLTDCLTAKYHCVLTGFRADRTNAEQVELRALEDHVPGLISLVERLTLEELIFVLRRVSVLITTDSGPLHIALGVETPAVVLLRPGDPDKVFSFKKRGLKSSVVTSTVSCNPCVLDCETRGRAECLEQIPIDVVVKETERLMAAYAREDSVYEKSRSVTIR